MFNSTPTAVCSCKQSLIIAGLIGFMGSIVLFASVLLAANTTAAPLIILGAPVVHIMVLLQFPNSALFAGALGFILYSSYAGLVLFLHGLYKRLFMIAAILVFHILCIFALNLLPALGFDFI